ncbi:hypothetical protein L917_10098, partial [Phytophthora nicotianae]
MQPDCDGGTWRETFDELLVFEQDFDTAMQILMFQDEKVARLSLEDSQQTRSQRTRSRHEAPIRGQSRSPSRKRRRVEKDGSQHSETPTFPASQTQDDRLTQSSTLTASNSMQPGSGLKIDWTAGGISRGPEVADAGRGGEAGMGLVASLFCTGSGKQVSISKAKLDTYERQMCEDDSE